MSETQPKATQQNEPEPTESEKEKKIDLQSVMSDIKKAYSDASKTMRYSAWAAAVLIIAIIVLMFFGIKFAINYEEYVQEYSAQEEGKVDKKDDDKVPFDSEMGKPMLITFGGAAALAVLSALTIMVYNTALRQRSRYMEMLDDHRKYLEKLHAISLTDPNGERYRLYAKLIEK